MEVAVEVEDLHKSYGDTVAVAGVDLRVEEGEVFGILGRNGAGKSTTVEAIAGLRAPDRGRVRVLGLDPRRDRARVRQVLGVQLQDSSLHGSLRVGELLRLHRSFHAGGADPDALMAELGLQEQRDQAFDSLSGGQQQRLSVALALVGRPRVVILDELSTGLDPRARREAWATVQRLRDDGVTVLLVSHVMEEVEHLCDRVAVLERGQVLALDSPAGLIDEVAAPHRVHFRTRQDVDVPFLQALPDVTDVGIRGEHVVVTGTGDLLEVVSTALVHVGVVATGTRLERPSLDDAFLTLTGRALDDGSGADHADRQDDREQVRR